jgi:uncharacterized iron-regulated protein
LSPILKLTPTAAAILCTLSVFAQAADAAPATLLADHPLTGTLWETRSGKVIDEDQLMAEAASARWVLIGEKHDNAEHHRLQARVVGALGESGRRFAVVWEMAEPEQQGALGRARLENVAGLGQELDWEARGWPAWSEYQPIAEQALAHTMPMFAGKPSRSILKGFSRGEALPPELAAAIEGTPTYTPDVAAEVRAEMAANHCGALPETALGPMVQVQWLWDATMAAGLRAARRSAPDIGGAILIAGSGHVREDRAVPWHLPGDSLSIALVEVARGQEEASDYGAFDPRLYDFVWFTARVDEKDPCEAFGKAPPE